MNTFLSAFINGVLLSIPVTIAAWLALRLTPRRALNAATRYVVLWAILLIVLVLPALYLPHAAIHRSAPMSQAISQTLAPLPPIAEPDEPSITTTSPARSVTLPFSVPAGRWPAAILAIWAGASLLLLLRLAVSWIILERRKARSTAPPSYLVHRGDAWLSRCLSTRRVTLRVATTEIGGPMATGPWRPSILFPARFFDEFPGEEIDQIGLHEAAHLARRDDYALALQRVIEAVFFFHPAVRWIMRQLNLEREIACDDFVVQLTGVPRLYASCLTRVAEVTAGIRPSLAAAAVTDESSHLTTRVEMLLDKTRLTGTRLMKVPLVAGIAGLLSLGALATEMPVLFNLVTPVRALAQTVNVPVAPVPEIAPVPKPAAVAKLTPHNEDVQVEPAPSPAPLPRFTTSSVTQLGQVRWRMGGAVVNTTATSIDYRQIYIKSLFAKAWPMPFYQFVWPAGMEKPNGNIPDAWYDVSATMSADTTPEQLQQMFQSFLADRFKVSSHWETRNLEVYALKVASDGLKMQQAAIPAGATTSYYVRAANTEWHMISGSPKAPYGMELPQFVTALTSRAGLPVVDETGLEGSYSIDLTVADDPNSSWNAATFKAALETQLGLTIEKQTVPTKMLIIDNLDLTPVAN